MYYASDKRKPFNWDLNVDAGEYYNGRQLRASGGFVYSLQPWASVGLSYNLSWFDLPEPYSSNDVYYVGPKVDISFTRSLFFSTTVQYSSLSRCLVVYGRIQWRFRPLSDIFLVFTSNKDVELGRLSNENLILKMNWCF